MQTFTNEAFDFTQLPKHEAISLTSLHANYWKVLLIKVLIFFLVFASLLVLAIVYIEELMEFQAYIWIAYALIWLMVLFFTRISFNNKAFLFREHDVIFKHGVIASTTMIIPYNRIQHVALHEGFIERWFELATVEIYTAGGTASDLAIPGLDKFQADDIKQLLMEKIQKQL